MCVARGRATSHTRLYSTRSLLKRIRMSRDYAIGVEKGIKMKAGPRLILNLVFSAILVASAAAGADARDRGGQSGAKKTSGGADANTGAAKKSTGVVQTGPIVRDHSGSGTPYPSGFTAQPPKNTGQGTVRDHRTPWTPPGRPCGPHRGCK